MGLFFYFCVFLCHIVVSVSCSLVVTCWERADLLADVLLCLYHFSIRCPGSGVLLDCIDS